MDAVIETDHLTKRYGRKRGVQDLDLAVGRGQVFGFLGPNGAGKTTTIRLLLDLLHPSSGSARLFGLDSRLASRAIHARIGNLPGEFSYEQAVTGRELLSFFAALRGIRSIGRAQRLAERFEADLSRPLGQLSSGNRQKIGLIQALFHEPELLILDEPTTGLDPLMQREFLTVLAEHRDRGATVFLSSHDLGEVERACDYVAIIRDGRLAAIESVQDVRSRAYRNVMVRFAEPVSAVEFSELPGVQAVVTDGPRTLRLRARGDIDSTLKALARHRVQDIEVTRPSLDELFMSYYDERVAS